MKTTTKTFLAASEVQTKLDGCDYKKIEKFIDFFNCAFKKEEFQNGDGSFSTNDGLSNIPLLNGIEYEIAKEMARKQGWRLIWFADNYNTTTYKMEKIEAKDYQTEILDPWCKSCIHEGEECIACDEHQFYIPKKN